MSAGKKQPYAAALPVAERLVDALWPHCERIEIAGSLRRQRAFVGDIELVALQRVTETREFNLFGEETAVSRTYQLHEFLTGKVELTKGAQPDAKYKSFMYGRFKVDLFLPETADHWGSIFTIRTGSHDFNLWLMNVAAPQAGVKFRGGRLWRDGVVLETPEERDVFAALGLRWIPPDEGRDGQGWLAYT